MAKDQNMMPTPTTDVFFAPKAPVPQSAETQEASVGAEAGDTFDAVFSEMSDDAPTEDDTGREMIATTQDAGAKAPIDPPAAVEAQLRFDLAPIDKDLATTASELDVEPTTLVELGTPTAPRDQRGEPILEGPALATMLDEVSGAEKMFGSAPNDTSPTFVLNDDVPVTEPLNERAQNANTETVAAVEPKVASDREARTNGPETLSTQSASKTALTTSQLPLEATSASLDDTFVSTPSKLSMTQVNGEGAQKAPTTLFDQVRLETQKPNVSSSAKGPEVAAMPQPESVIEDADAQQELEPVLTAPKAKLQNETAPAVGLANLQAKASATQSAALGDTTFELRALDKASVESAALPDEVQHIGTASERSTQTQAVTAQTATQAKPASYAQVAAQMREALPIPPDQPVEISLSPEELGRVRMVVTQVEAGVAIQITAERNETLELLRRNLDALTADLENLGYSEMSFALGGEANHSDGQEGRGSSYAAQDQVSGTDDVAVATLELPPTSANGGLDIRL